MNDLKNNIRSIAFYLPQFHPIKENDEWWGKGFTEWRNVTEAKPLFKGHQQPNLPRDLGFYDLRLSETRSEQANLAKEYGISGFCYWHYWFSGKRILEQPFQEVLKLKSPNFPFCLGWANHSWTGIWQNEPGKCLIKQTYSGIKDDINHFNFLKKAFKDKRYIKINGKPLFIIFKPNDIPNLKKKLDFWRELSFKNDLKGLYVLGINMNDINSGKELGLDGLIFSTLGVVTSNNKYRENFSKFFWRFRRRFKLGGPRVINYKDIIDYLIPNLDSQDVEGFPCIFPNWDNTPRLGRRGLVLHNSKPEYFEILLKKAIKEVLKKRKQHQLIFIKSWNEWAEGNYLEPDLKWRRQYLEIVKKNLKR